ncbi:MAG: hypothetical protein ACI8UG_000590 [Gammaproteobacteria bacterium]|jgi:hypothetical protein
MLATFYMLLRRFGRCKFDLVVVVMALISSFEWGNLLQRKRLNYLKLLRKEM